MSDNQTTADTEELAHTLHDFRQFVLDNATQWKSGAGHHNPIWARVTAALDKHGANKGPGLSFAYYQFHPSYREESRG